MNNLIKSTIIVIITTIILFNSPISSSKISQQIGKDYFRINHFSSSSKLASKEFQNRVKFYEEIIKKWKNEKILELSKDDKTYNIKLLLKKVISNADPVKVNWKYFVTTCDFTPFKEKYFEKIIEYMKLNPEANNDLFNNILLLTYQVLYYRKAEPSIITQFYEKNLFKSQTYNKKVFQFTKSKGAKKYISEIVPFYSSLKISSLFYSPSDIEFLESIGIDVNFPRQVDGIYKYIKNSFLEEVNQAEKEIEEYLTSNQHDDLKKTEGKDVKLYDLNLKKKVLNEVLTIISSEIDYKTILSYIIKSIQIIPYDFYYQRFQQEEKSSYDFYIKTFGSHGKLCYYIGPLIDIMTPDLNMDLKDNDKNHNIELEFTSFNDVNLYSSQVQKKDGPFKFTYPLPLSYERLIFEFNPNLIFHQILNPVLPLPQSNSASSSSSSSSNLTIISYENSINIESDSNKHENTLIKIYIRKTDFSLNQYKFCAMINCGENGLVSKFLQSKTSTSEEELEYEHVLNINTSQVNIELYNLLRIYELDDFISTTPLNTKEFIENTLKGEAIHQPEDGYAYVKYLELLLDNDSNEKYDYSELIIDYYKASSLQKGMEGFANSLSEKIFSEIGNMQVMLLAGLQRKFVLYSQIELIMNRVESRVEEEIKNVKGLVLNRKS